MSQSIAKPLFSVIVATYNGAQTLERALNSILSQSYRSYEVIVVDDGSTDNTKEIIAKYNDKVRYLYQENSGVSSARNAGVKIARGQWLSFLDADDWYCRERLQRFADIVEMFPNVDFVVGDYHYAKSDGEIIKRSIDESEFGRHMLETADEKGLNLLEASGLGRLIVNYFGHTSTFALPKKTFLDLEGYSTEFNIGEDLHLLIRLCSVSRAAGIVCEPLSCYCIHETGLMRSNAVHAQYKTVDMLLSLKEAKRFWPKPLKFAYNELLSNARYDLAVALLKKGDRIGARKAFFPALFENGNPVTLKRLLSIIIS